MSPLTQLHVSALTCRNGERINITYYIAQQRVDTQLKLTVLRGGQEMTLDLR